MKLSKTVTPDANSYATELLDRCWLTEITFEIRLKRPPSFTFEPGQRIRFQHHSIERDYSIITTPDDTTLALCIYHVEEGPFSPILAAAAIGTSFTFTGPHGYFTYRPSERSAVFVATGTGIAPFLSIGRSGVTGFTLLHGVKTSSDLYYQPFFRSCAAVYVPCLSERRTETPPTDGFHGRVTRYLEEQFPPGIYDFYLSGQQEMIRDVTLLVDEKFPGSLVYTESFY
jgi:ferredoxin-NADP reductase